MSRWFVIVASAAAVAMMAHSGSLAQSFQIVHRSYSFGSIHATAATRLDSSGGFPLATDQTIFIHSDQDHTDRTLDLGQRRTWDRAHRHVWLDSLAYSWRCLRKPDGATYLAIDFACVNENAQSCSAGMGTPRNEWMQLYGDTGYKFFRDLSGGIAANEEEHVRALGLWDQLMSLADTENPQDIFF
jgi:hypothetical protein